MLRFEPSPVSESMLEVISVAGNHNCILGLLVRLKKRGFELKVATDTVFTAAELRAIADELDRLNRAGEGT